MPEILNRYESLEPFYEAAREETARQEESFPVDLRQASRATLSLAGALDSNEDVAVIAEYKWKSPSEGVIRPDSTVEEIAAQYSRGGATALSVLTQGKHFGGRIQDLAFARDVSCMPILRKDFIDNEYQLHEAKWYGADAVLLIVGGLSDARLRTLYREAERIELDCLVEVHDREELGRALKIEPQIIGVNNRDLNTLEVDLSTAEELLPQVPDGIVTVAESGYSVREPDHIRRLRELGTNVLMGTALMHEADPAAALSKWLATDQ